MSATLAYTALSGVAPVNTPSESTRLDQAWQILNGVLDPELPVVSIVELGIVRSVSVEGQGFLVAVTPTYTGCPAVAVIHASIAAAFEAQGLRVRIANQLAPAWTTEWLTQKARASLMEYGIAPPACAPSTVSVDWSALQRTPAQPVPCPRCHSIDTRVVSQFGSTACKALYRCVACREPFDYFKPH